MQRANASGAIFALIIGDDEVLNRTATLKDLATGEEQKLPFSACAEALHTLLDIKRFDIGNWVGEDDFSATVTKDGIVFKGNALPDSNAE
jgi:hypothetical protein